jgi:DNA mismatch endonuclease (patch repair protein)
MVFAHIIFTSAALSFPTGVFTKTKRSEVMSRIRGRGNMETELALVRLLRAARITGWRRQVQIILGRSRGDEAQTFRADRMRKIRASSRRLLQVRADFTFRKERLVIFVDGCFWHGCPKHSNLPANNREFWLKKLTGNKGRDRLVTRALRQSGWRVLRIWEHELTRKHQARCVGRLRRLLEG